MTKASKEQLQTICLFLFINKIKNIKKNQKNKTKQKKESCQCDDRNRASLQYPYFKYCRSKNENIMLISVGHICTTEMKLTRKL